jgi:uncharacterized membrane protein
MRVKRLLEELWTQHRGKLLGTLFGFLLGVLYLLVGFWRMLVVALLILGGYYVGKKADEKERLRDVLARILPDHFFRDDV